jgi:type I restriction enzyme S subunit
VKSGVPTRDSGLLWLGRIPAHWEVAKFSRVVFIAEGQVDPEDERYVKMLLVAPNHIESGTGRLVAHETAADQAAISGKYLCQTGDVVYSKIRPALKKATLATKQCLCSADMYPLRAQAGLDPQFLLLLLLSGPFTAWAILESDRVAMPKINRESLSDLRIPVPPLPEQRAVVAHLDRETARLDGLVSAKERVLRLVAEKQRALITSSVTRGLAPRASLRNSGIPWLGEIPAYWGIWKIGHFAAVGNGSTPSRDNAEYWTEGLIPWLNSSVVNQEEVTEAEQFITETAFRECHLPLVKSGSVLVGITGQGKTRGQAVVLSFEATINQHLAFITPKKGVADPWFLRWALFAAYDFLRSISDDAGGTKGALTCEEVGALRMPLPPIDEQRAIVAYITAETAKLDALRAATERTIALLKERRAALIAAAVTGRITIHESTGDNLPGGSHEH